MNTPASPPPPTGNPVAAYLAALKQALRGADKALAHDALVDAETHLRQAIGAGAAPAAAVADYGTPEDIARAYLEAGPVPAATAPAKRRLRDIKVVGIWFDPHAWGSLAFLTIGFLFALAAFLWLAGLGFLAVGLLPALIGALLLIPWLGSARGLSLALGKLIAWCTGVRMPMRVRPVNLAGVRGFFGRLWCWVSDGRSWLSAILLIGQFPVALFCCAFFAALLTFGTQCVELGVLSGARILETDPASGQAGIPVMQNFRLPPAPCYMDDGHGNMVPIKEDEIMGILVLPSAWTEKTGDQARLTVWSRLFFLGLGAAWLTGTLWLAKGAGWLYAQAVKAVQVARPTAER